MEQPLFHVVLEGRRVGPYDRRTLMGMRIKKALRSDHVLVDADGVELTVADLIARRERAPGFHPQQSGSFSIVQATYPASLVAVHGTGLQVPRFQGEMEVRVQGGVLRLAGRRRRGLGWREDRVKLPIGDIVHAGRHGSAVTLGLRARPGAVQRITLELFTPETAQELVGWCRAAAPWPAGGAAPPSRPGRLSHPLVPVLLAVGLIVACVSAAGTWLALAGR